MKLPPLDPPNQVAIEAIAEHLIGSDDAVELLAEALELSVGEFLDQYAPTLLN